MLEPRYQSLSVLGYSKSVPTPGSIEAEVVVVKDFDELISRSSEVKLKCNFCSHFKGLPNLSFQNKSKFRWIFEFIIPKQIKI